LIIDYIPETVYLRRLTTSLLICLSLAFAVSGQDLHYSQFYHSPLNINPALTGIFSGNMRFNGNYRSQWESVPVPYETFSAAFDTHLSTTDKGILSGGLLFNYDQAGDSKLRLAQLGLSSSYSFLLDESNILSLGAQLGFAQRAFKENNLTFGSQYDGSEFNPNLPTGENFDNTGKFVFDVNAGANYRWQQDDRTKFDLGVSFFHINKPSSPFYDNDDIKLPLRFSALGSASIELSNRLDLLVHVLGQFQSKYQETFLGGAVKFYINKDQRGKEFAVAVGAGGRFSDALVPVLILQGRAWRVGASYDVNTSPFNSATDNRGGIELSFTYIITKVPLMPFKVCPIY
jgi:type IX secretion system PorP/SprF family membrane protein